ncbi:MAG: 16S rRNA (cytidine(1402)-2'-O)-methyltransferase [Chloroflexi bacterium]|nr:16S rRNA (cytidine(1402)-2'-O)-methyltransferase [Chloroflexota bacterium]
MGTLYIVPTPIGNLEDITLRALRILKEVALIAAEDTRTSRVLTRHFNIDTPMTSYHEHNKLSKLDVIFSALESADVALISDAGTPGISDPGFELIDAALKNGYTVVPLPGANAITTALVGSGMATDRFLFVGYLPRKAAALRAQLTALSDRQETVVAYESPYRLSDTLSLIVEIMGEDRRVCVARELSKKFEQFCRGGAGEVRAHFLAENPRGEVTLVIAGADEGAAIWSQAEVETALSKRLTAGEPLSQAARIVAKAAGWTKGAVYQLGISKD